MFIGRIAHDVQPVQGLQENVWNHVSVTQADKSSEQAFWFSRDLLFRFAKALREMFEEADKKQSTRGVPLRKDSKGWLQKLDFSAEN